MKRLYDILVALSTNKYRMDWCIIDFDSTLGFHVANPKEFFQPFDYKNPNLFTPSSEILKQTRGKKTLAVVRVSFVDSAVWSFDCSIYDAVLVVDCELIDQSLDFYMPKLQRFFKNDNVFLAVSATRKRDYHDHCIIYPFFLPQTAKLNLNIPAMRFDKPKLFDALLGLNKAHRKFVITQLQRHDLMDKTYASLLKYNLSEPKNVNQFLFRSEDLDQVETPEALITINNHGYFDSYDCVFSVGEKNNNNISAQIPFGVYDHSYYSIVCETQSSEYWFFTEKTAKPLVSKRPFIMFGSSLNLETLHDLGFKTFGNIIDESYDLEFDDQIRFEKAFEQVIHLSKLDPREVFYHLDDVLEHNHRHIMNGEYFLSPVKDWLLTKLQG